MGPAYKHYAYLHSYVHATRLAWSIFTAKLALKIFVNYRATPVSVDSYGQICCEFRGFHLSPWCQIAHSCGLPVVYIADLETAPHR